MKLSNPGPALTVEDIKAFERDIDASLPEDYCQFLLANNGGIREPEHGFYGFRMEGELKELLAFTPLLAAEDTGLRRALRNLLELGIDEYLPIARTLYGEYICLEIRSAGAVWLAVFPDDNDTDVEKSLVFLAKSFSEFLDKVVPIPFIYCPIEDLGHHGTPTLLAEFLAEGNSIDEIGKNGLTIVCEAIKYDNVPLVEACIERGASLSKTVYMAAQNRRPKLVKMVVDAGADVNEENEFGTRPLHYVVGTALPGERGAKNRAMRELLIELGAK